MPRPTARLGLIVGVSKTQEWLPMMGPPVRQWLRLAMSVKLSWALSVPVMPTRPPGSSSMSSGAQSRISAAWARILAATSPAACTTELPVMKVTRLAVVPQLNGE